MLLNGAEKTVAAILPVLDDMERALASAEKTDDAEALKEGMKLIFQKFEKVLGGLGVNKIETRMLTSIPTCTRLSHGAWHGRREEGQGARLRADRI